MPKISLIVAMASNRVIGKGNQMPWHLPADLKHFKAVTMGKPVVMGRKTHESIGMVLPGRKNIIISRDANYASNFYNDQCLTVTSLEQGLEAAKVAVGEANEIMIIGGANIYQQMIEQADKLYLTFIDLDTEGDAHFPDWTHLEWQEVSREEYKADEKNPFNYQFVTLERK
ncbi:type 3 dihydrofolate reductase [Kangiella sp. TOML190]|uniref:type 3 dihydrofolate reductase n=1 Tax=Kangiella sp. TOML190 TaxID=2931351 RepID=UPI00203DBE99|nr:type 3 dihydrofolate reductase [Kangiella sp. TOML190]